ncbi:hypothetical protein EXE41_17100 [Halorubrum sp. SD690R]|uniref:pentapeptide repeat-containing protein n=1 Tax=Halorubrum sp. SD690R TaxID=2518117 RepID=UPI0010F9A38B|nr:pentapeptide repeat-containing protein [Halorubrum sp. SD690R]TKX42465.1 hypothetical protein EXE41_17100 [Halorubrum sp. SD690R]
MTDQPEEFDGEVPENRCGYTYPEDFDAEQDPYPDQQNSCIREPLPDTERCAVHADPAETEQKAEQLKRADSFGDSLDGAILPALLADSVDFSDISLLRGADLSKADMSGEGLFGVDLSGAELMSANLSKANLRKADLSGAVLIGANMSKANLSPTPYGETADLSAANLADTNLSEAFLKKVNLSGANLDYADLPGADLRGADLREVDFRRADLSEAILSGANLSEANLEQATLIEVNLFDSCLTKVTPYGARIEAVQINNGTIFNSETSEYKSWKHSLPFFSCPPRCGYDPQVEQPKDFADTDRETLLTKAADTYRKFGELARQNTQPSRQSLMFVLRQDMQRIRHRERGEYTEWFTNSLFRVIFKYGESFARVLLTAAVIILTFAGVYWQADLIISNPNAAQSQKQFISDPVDAIYFSTLTFTTLGLGDFQPAAASQLGRGMVLLQAVLGAVLIATFVFVLGRRAAR